MAQPPRLGKAGNVSQFDLCAKPGLEQLVIKTVITTVGLTVSIGLVLAEVGLPIDDNVDPDCQCVRYGLIAAGVHEVLDIRL